LPNLAIERWVKGTDLPPDSPIVLTLEGPHGLIIHRVTKTASKRGSKAGARLTDARALDPTLIALPADLEGDLALVRRLALWAGRWSPLVEMDGDGLCLDVTGVAHLFGGEHALVHDIQRRFEQMGLTARVAIAPTAAAAWALSHFARSVSIVAAEAVQCWHDELLPLHVSALRLDPDTVRTLERLGLKTIGTLIGVPRFALARRFRGAENVIEALDRMLGRKAEAITAVTVDPPPRALLRLEEPATHSEAAFQVLDQLIADLVRQLQERHLGARRISLIGFRVDGSCALASVATAIPSREPKHLHRLLVDKARLLDPEFGFDAFALVAGWTEDLRAAQASLVEEPEGEGELARLVDRLTVKFGPKRVQRPQQQESHLPERASGWVSALATAEPIEMSAARRPQRLLDRPEAINVIYATPEGMPRRFVWRRSVHDIARSEGPERIAPEWWRQLSSTRLRDYYRVEDSIGRRYWIYREGIAGDGRGGPPNWFIHGLFG
jgi:protein ImuB